MFKKKRAEEEIKAEEAVELLKEKTEKQEAEIAALKAKLSEEEPEEVEQPKEVKKKEPVEDSYVISEVTTQTAPVIMNAKDQREVYTELTALCKIMNEVVEIRKTLG